MKSSIPALALSFALLAPLRAHDASNEMAAAANNFLSSLTPDEKAKVAFDFADAERTNWHFIPRERKGLQIKEMTQEQQASVSSNQSAERGSGAASSSFPMRWSVVTFSDCA